MQNKIGSQAFSQAWEEFKRFSQVIAVQTKHCKNFITLANNQGLNFVYDLDLNSNDLKNDFHLLKSSNVPFTIFCDTADSTFFEEQGFTFLDNTQAKTYDLNQAQYIYPKKLNITKVSTEEQLLLWRQISASNFDYPFGEDRFIFNDFLKPGSYHQKVELFLAYYHDQPVGGCMLVIQKEYTLNMWDSVLPEFRGKGFLKEMIAYRAALSKEKGYDLSIVQCMPSSSAIYDKMGYIDAEQIKLFGWQP